MSVALSSLDDEWEVDPHDAPTVRRVVPFPLVLDLESDEDTPLFSPSAEMLAALR